MDPKTKARVTAKLLFGQLNMGDIWSLIKHKARSAVVKCTGNCPAGGPYSHGFLSAEIRVRTMDEAGAMEDNGRCPVRNVGRRKGIHLMPPEDMAWKEGKTSWIGAVFVQLVEKVSVLNSEHLAIASRPSDWWTVSGVANEETVEVTFLDQHGNPIPNPLLP